MVKEIKLFGIHGTGKVSLVDDEDFVAVNKYKWRVDGQGYVNRKENNQIVMLHRFIMGAKNKTYIDHINHNPLDNRRENLRICSNKQNCWNSIKKVRKNSTNKQTKYKGVKWNKKIRKWTTAISKDGVRKHLGYFDNEEIAAKNYDFNAIKMYGEFAYLNFPNFNYTDFIPHKLNKLTSKYLFVCLTHNNTWKVAVPIKNQQIYIGRYSSEKEAAHHADYIMWKFYKNKEKLNFPEIDYDNFIPTKIVETARKIIFGENNDKNI